MMQLEFKLMMGHKHIREKRWEWVWKVLTNCCISQKDSRMNLTPVPLITLRQLGREEHTWQGD